MVFNIWVISKEDFKEHAKFNGTNYHDYFGIDQKGKPFVRYTEEVLTQDAVGTGVNMSVTCQGEDHGSIYFFNDEKLVFRGPKSKTENNDYLYQAIDSLFENTKGFRHPGAWAQAYMYDKLREKVKKYSRRSK